MSEVTNNFDVVVVGGGVAGAVTALQSAHHGARVAMVVKGELGDTTTRFAQGGIAVAQSFDHDVDVHIADTLNAGAALCDVSATRQLVESGPEALATLVGYGAIFDRAIDGSYLLSKEGGHSIERVVHAGGAATGAEVNRALVKAVQSSNITVFENTFATDLIVRGDTCVGVSTIDASGDIDAIEASAVVLATGGSGQLFAVTTNPPLSTGDGVAMAIRAGAVVADLEFVQFHPTALAVSTWPLPLLSEALRGDGALLVNASHERFVDELAPRDVVSRAIASEIAASAIDHVFLDARPIADFDRHFPSLAAILRTAQLDAASDLLPVVPAAHYLCGGVLTDLDGATTLPGLFAVGETACTGVEGANRLASNSLLEGMVYGARAAAVISQGCRHAKKSGAMRGLFSQTAAQGDPVPVRHLASPFEETSVAGRSFASVAEARSELARSMSTNAGVVRDEASLRKAHETLCEVSQFLKATSPTIGALELKNLVTVGNALVGAATNRQESRGAHTRSDYPRRDDDKFCWRIAVDGEIERRPISEEAFSNE